MKPPGTWPRHMTRMDRYGRLQVGQRVQWERLAAAPSNGRHGAWITGDGEFVTLRTEHQIEEIRSTETGAAIVLRHRTGAVQIAYSVDIWGVMRGHFGHLEVITDAPYQSRLIR